MLGRLAVDARHHGAAARAGGGAGGRDQLRRARLRARRHRGSGAPPSWRRRRPSGGRRWRSCGRSPRRSRARRWGARCSATSVGAAGADPVLTFYLMSEYARLVPTDLLGPYLVGRQLLARDPARALPHLARACDDGGPSTLPPEFVRECRRMIVDAGLPHRRLRARAHRARAAGRGRDRRGGSPARARHARARRLGRGAARRARWRAIRPATRPDATPRPPVRVPVITGRRRARVRQWPRWRYCDGPPCSGCVTLLAASAARAQVEPPPATTAAAGRAAARPPRHRPRRRAPPPAAATAPVDAAVADAGAGAAPRAAAGAHASEPRPSSRRRGRSPSTDKTWFWGAVGVVVVTRRDHPAGRAQRRTTTDRPHTTFGNMHAF